MNVEHKWKGYIMATSRKTRTIEHEPLTPEDVFQTPTPHLPPALVDTGMDDFDDLDDVSALNQVLAELGGDEESGFVTVYKHSRNNSGTVEKFYVGRFSAPDFSLDMLKEQQGAGKYEISVYRAGGKGLKTRKVINFAADTTTAKPETAAPVSAVDLTPILSTMQQGFKEMAGMIAQVVQHREKPKTTLEMLQEMQMMRELLGGNQPAAPTFNPMEMFKMGAELAQTAANPDSNGAWVNKMIEMAAPIMQAVLEKQAVPVAVAAPARLANPATAAVAQPVPQTTEDENGMNIMLKGAVKMMVNAAVQGAPVAEYADWALNMVPESMIGEMETLLKAPDWKERLTQFAPQVSQHEAWFTELRDTILQYIAEENAALGVGITGDSAIPPLTTGAAPATVIAHEDDHTPQPGSDNGNPAGTPAGG